MKMFRKYKNYIKVIFNSIKYSRFYEGLKKQNKKYRYIRKLQVLIYTYFSDTYIVIKKHNYFKCYKYGLELIY